MGQLPSETVVWGARSGSYAEVEKPRCRLVPLRAPRVRAERQNSLLGGASGLMRGCLAKTT
jgi:hypothetical protein